MNIKDNMRKNSKKKLSKKSQGFKLRLWKKFFKFKALDKDDEVDIELERALMDRDLAFPILKFEHGFYLFGTKKMFMKVLFDGLLVKVGSNFLTVSDFLASYYDKEEKGH